MKKIFQIVLVTILFFAFISCEEDNQVIYEKDARLVWTGEYDLDGCGFFIEIDSVSYKPENEGILPPEYKTSEPLEVDVQFINLLYDIEYPCGLTGTQTSPGIKLTYLSVDE